MPCTLTTHPRAHVLRVEGRFLGAVERPALVPAVEERLAGGHANLVVDLAGVGLIDSAGINLLLTLLHLVRQAGGGLHLAGVQGRPRQILTMTRLLDTVFADYPSVEAAAAAFGVPPSVAA